MTFLNILIYKLYMKENNIYFYFKNNNLSTENKILLFEAKKFCLMRYLKNLSYL